MRKGTVKGIAALLSTALLTAFCLPAVPALAADEEVVLRVCNWEEYIDLGDWDEDERIDLESGDIIGENSMVEDFEQWYLETYGKKVRVEYSTFGTNEDLYNMLTLGDVYDVVCPSEYMIMKLMAEEQLVPLSQEFTDPENPDNYYIRGLSPYIKDVFDRSKIKGESWSKYMAGYMWGLTGIVYNPEVVSKEDASTWKILTNPKYYRQITLKDNVRDSYFAAVGALKSDLLTSEAFRNDPEYGKRLEEEMNDTSPETIAAVQDYLQQSKDNLYSFETDSGKADMITGKVVANYQWSGDACYTLDQADEDGVTLYYAVPEESTNIYFDGWVMLKRGIGQNQEKQKAAEAFMNFVSRPDNAIRNMYYIGYTSVISGGEDNRIFEYLDWNYGADEAADESNDETADETVDEAVDETVDEAVDETVDEENAEYDLSYFFGDGEPSDEYILTVPVEQLNRQLLCQYPSQEVISRSSIMIYFDEQQTEDINKMWIGVRCFNIKNVPVWVWCVVGIVMAGLLAMYIKKRHATKIG